MDTEKMVRAMKAAISVTISNRRVVIVADDGPWAAQIIYRKGVFAAPKGNFPADEGVRFSVTLFGDQDRTSMPASTPALQYTVEYKVVEGELELVRELPPLDD